MFDKILIPTDLSQKNVQALKVALKMAGEVGSKVTLLHVIETIEDDEGEFNSFYDKLRKRAEKNMNEIAAKYSSEKVPVHQEIVYGKRVREIIRYAHDNDVDLIIISSHRIDNLDDVGSWATISYQVGILSHCPVMMIK